MKPWIGLAAVAALGLAACGAGESDTDAGIAADTQAGSDADCVPVPGDAWVRLPPTQMPMAGGFLLIANVCAQPARIVAADSDAFEAVELHETTLEDGVSRMREVPALEIPAHEQVALEPGGLHLMLMRPLRELAPGETVTVRFELEDARSFSATFELRAAGDAGMHGGGHGHDH